MALGLILMNVNCAFGQAPSVATLKVELQNLVYYEVDTPDFSKFGTNANLTPSGLRCTGPSFGGNLGNKLMGIGDIVAVNGQPARGTYTAWGSSLCLSPIPTPGQPIAATTAGPALQETYDIQQSDGTPVGSIMTNGLRGVAPPPPGLPAGNQNFAIVGGTGAFLGVRGQTSNALQGLGSAGIQPRAASITEDPANRRINGGGHVVFTLYVIPESRPEVAVTAGGAAITHANDFSLVNAARPAVAGEILSLFANGLGPTRLGLSSGQPFPSNPAAVVNSPLDVTVNGKSAEVLGAVGYPGSFDGYQVNFRVPVDTAKGSATIQVIAAWIAGAPVSIPVQ
jgi:hypothetical protein